MRGGGLRTRRSWRRARPARRRVPCPCRRSAAGPGRVTRIAALGHALGERVRRGQLRRARRAVSLDTGPSRRRRSGASTDCSRMAVVSARPMPSAESTPAMRRHEDGADAERVGDRARVLAARAAEGGEGVAGDVVALLHRDPLDGVGHVGHGDLQEALGDLLGGAVVAGPSRGSRRRGRRSGRGPASSSSGWSPSGPNTAGKWAGWMRPSITLASVTVSGPPRR